MALLLMAYMVLLHFCIAYPLPPLPPLLFFFIDNSGAEFHAENHIETWV